MHILIIIIKLYTKHINRIYISSIDGYTAHLSVLYSENLSAHTQSENMIAFLFDSVRLAMFMDVYYFNCFDLNAMCCNEPNEVLLAAMIRKYIRFLVCS